jgi:hypothetical protein
MATISSRTELTSLDDNNDVLVIDDVSAVVTKKVKVSTFLKKTQDGSTIYAADAGANDTYAVTLSLVPTVYTTGMVVNFKANTANTGAATLNVNSLGAKTIKKNKDQDLSDNDIKSGQVVTVIYDGTNFQMQSQLANSGVTTGGTETITGGKTFSGDNTFSGTNTHTGAELFTGNLIGKLFAPQGFLINGKISTSVSSNNLTVAIKTLAGTDASATDPIYVRIGDTVRSITAALSISANAATNWFAAGSAELATKEIDYFVYLGYNATDGVVLGFSRIPGATQYSDFSTTSTNEKYCRISTITTAAATDYYEVIGRFAATLSAGAGYTWSVPTFTASNLIQRPIYETRWLTWEPALSVSGGTAPTYTAVFISRYRIYSSNVEFSLNWQNAAGGTAGAGANSIISMLPFSILAGNFTSVLSTFGVGWSYESAGTKAILNFQSGTAANLMGFFIATTVLRLTGAEQSDTVRYIFGNGNYEI